jgi:hypothetical protein
VSVSEAYKYKLWEMVRGFVAVAVWSRLELIKSTAPSVLFLCLYGKAGQQ